MNGTQAGLLEQFTRGGDWDVRLQATNDELTFDTAEISWRDESGVEMVLDPAVLTAGPLVQMRKIVLAVAGRKIADFVGADAKAVALQKHIGNSVALLEADAGPGRQWYYATQSVPTYINFTFTLTQ